jgi:triosephosphate isomerase (TIM)
MASARTPLIAGNWKMHLNHLEAIAHVQKLAYVLTDADYASVEVAVLTPFTDLRSVQTLVDADKVRVGYGAQDLSMHDSGAYTGEVSGAMLAKLGCGFVLVGHSERRQYHQEDDAVVAAKAAAAWRHGLTPILCAGEPLQVRQAGDHEAHTVSQVRAALEGVPAVKVATMVIAYEPIWAIGTGEVATPDDAQAMAAAIRGSVAASHGDAAADGVRILYGGSVKPDSTPAIMAGADVDGALVGGASLDPDTFVSIIRYRDAAA